MITPKPFAFALCGKLARKCGSPVCAHNVALIGHTVVFQLVDRLFDDRQIAVRTHDNSNFFHNSNLRKNKKLQLDRCS